MTDVIDCGIDICAKEIIGRVKDDYNIKSFNTDFVNNVIESEISSDKVFYWEVKD